MKVNISKCELLVFHCCSKKRRELEGQPVLYRGEQIKLAHRAKYLGLCYGPPIGQGINAKSLFINSWTELLSAGKHATNLLLARLSAAGLHIPHTVLQFYNTCVRPVFSFGAQVWSTSYLTGSMEVALKHPMVVEQCAFLRRVIGAQKASNVVALMELSQLPMQHHWAGLVFRFWNKLVKHTNTLFHNTFRSDIRLALVSQRGWAFDVIEFLRTLQEPGLLALPDHASLSHDEIIEHYCKLKLPVERLQEVIASKLLCVWNSVDLDLADPRAYGGVAPTKVCRHKLWMGSPDQGKGSGTLVPLPHTRLAMAREKHICLMRFRTGCWELEGNRAYGNTRPRTERVCRLCVEAGLGDHIEDEKHVLLECATHNSLRASFPALPFDQGMLSLMAHPDQKALANFLCKLCEDVEHALDASINNLECDICGSADNARDMYLCDGRCCRGFHLTCLGPSLVRPPAHKAWFCPDCTSRVISH